MTPLAPMSPRNATEDEIDHLAAVWYAAWQDGHAHVLPGELARLRTEESFRPRLRAALPHTRVVGPPGAPVGFCIVEGDELYQLFVAREARGSGAAAALLADGEARIAEGGTEVAWLACAIGNERAARFYEKSGWRRAGTMVSQLETTEGRFDLEVWRYEKELRPGR
jgi:ribosomal protein S18 acetylase RimI-like enzyme